MSVFYDMSGSLTFAGFYIVVRRFTNFTSKPTQKEVGLFTTTNTTSSKPQTVVYNFVVTSPQICTIDFHNLQPKTVCVENHCPKSKQLWTYKIKTLLIVNLVLQPNTWIIKDYK